MKITTTTLLLGCIMLTHAKAQFAMDMVSDQNQFYASNGNTVSKYTMNGGVVSAVPPDNFTCSGTIYSIAYGNDIINGSTNRTLYASTMDGWECSLLRWSGTDWDVLMSDTMMYLNGGAYGPYIYYLKYDYNVTPSTQSIVRLESDGTLQTVFQDNTKQFTVADIAVDSLGNIYCFRGTSVGNTSELTIISPTGNIIASYATNLNYGMGYYGAMIINGTLYLGQEDGGTMALWPITFSGTTASMGVPVYNSFTMTDLANGHGPISNLTLGTEKPFTVSKATATMQGNYLNIHNSGEKTIIAELFDTRGQQVFSETIQQNNISLDMHGLSNGIYVVRITSGNDLLLAKKLKVEHR